MKQRLAAAGIILEQVSTLGRRAIGIDSTLRAKVLAWQIEFPDVPELRSQLRRLEIVRGSGGGKRCEASSGHNDIAIATALTIHECVAQLTRAVDRRDPGWLARGERRSLVDENQSSSRRTKLQISVETLDLAVVVQNGTK